MTAAVGSTVSAVDYVDCDFSDVCSLPLIFAVVVVAVWVA